MAAGVSSPCERLEPLLHFAGGFAAGLAGQPRDIDLFQGQRRGRADRQVRVLGRGLFQAPPAASRACGSNPAQGLDRAPPLRERSGEATNSARRFTAGSAVGAKIAQGVDRGIADPAVRVIQGGEQIVAGRPAGGPHLLQDLDGHGTDLGLRRAEALAESRHGLRAHVGQRADRAGDKQELLPVARILRDVVQRAANGLGAQGHDRLGGLSPGLVVAVVQSRQPEFDRGLLGCGPARASSQGRIERAKTITPISAARKIASTIKAHTSRRAGRRDEGRLLQFAIAAGSRSG